MEQILNSLQETKELAEKIAQSLKPQDIIALYGNLGSGKTTFVKYVAESLQINVRVQSPTFIILRKYKNNKLQNAINQINHLDLYRLSSQNELQVLDLVELFAEPTSITIIEWPEIAENILPKKTKRIKFEYLSEDKRKVYV